MTVINFIKPIFYCSALLLQACSSLGGAAVDVAKSYYETRNPVAYSAIELKPELVYLEVHTEASSALMVLAQVDKAADEQGVVETWVSAKKEVLRTRAGFIAGSQAVAGFPDQVDVLFAPDGARQGLIFTQGGVGAHGIRIRLDQAVVDSPALMKSKLFARANKVEGLVMQAWNGRVDNPAERLKVLDRSFHVVGTHPQSGKLIYALHCMQRDSCVELLVRTATQNL